MLLEVGGWPHTVGEDIVLSWKILRTGCRVAQAENAIAMTRYPDTVRQLIRQRQRQRWSRGLIEASKMRPALPSQQVLRHFLTNDTSSPQLLPQRTISLIFVLFAN